MATGPTARTGVLDDASLARAAAAGDRASFAAIYDRYADRLHDFCVGMLRDRDGAADCVQDTFVTAATRLPQLREPERLRSWLYAIARNEALARIKRLRRERPTEELPEMASTGPGLDALAARSELADLIDDACGGLSDRDRVVLELAYRQDLAGPELAEALGVAHKHANILVERLRTTIARSLGALLVCRSVKADPTRCQELAALIDDWDGAFTVLIRKRAARHIESCPICDERRGRMVSPAALLGATPVMVPAPVWLRERTLEQAGPALPTHATAQSTGDVDNGSWWPPNDFDTQPQGRRKALARAGLGAALLLIAVGGAARILVPPTYSVEPVDVVGPMPTTRTSVTITGSRPSPTMATIVVPSGNPERAATPPPARPTSVMPPAGVVEPAVEQEAVPVAPPPVNQQPDRIPASAEPAPAPEPEPPPAPAPQPKPKPQPEPAPQPEPIVEEPAAPANPPKVPMTKQPNPFSPPSGGSGGECPPNAQNCNPSDGPLS